MWIKDEARIAAQTIYDRDGVVSATVSVEDLLGPWTLTMAGLPATANETVNYNDRGDAESDAREVAAVYGTGA